MQSVRWRKIQMGHLLDPSMGTRCGNGHLDMQHMIILHISARLHFKLDDDQKDYVAPWRNTCYHNERAIPLINPQARDYMEDGLRTEGGCSDLDIKRMVTGHMSTTQ